MKTSEIKELTTKEIIERLESEKEALVKSGLNHAISPLDNPMQIRAVRRNIARLQTVLRQRQLNENQK
ncbi:50S ribosomal protein L29 [Puteibacter caeruleilacunae]|nr:50S ribosomal protein L29 [Puteibacter caeruleilacunae]